MIYIQRTDSCRRKVITVEAVTSQELALALLAEYREHPQEPKCSYYLSQKPARNWTHGHKTPDLAGD